MNKTQNSALFHVMNNRYPGMASPQLAGLFLDAAIRALEPDQELEACTLSLTLVRQKLHEMRPSSQNKKNTPAQTNQELPH